MLNPAKLLKIKSSWDRFTKNHPKFEPFVKAVQRNSISDGTIIEINITTKEGNTVSTNLKLTEDDMDLFHELSELAKK